MSKEYFYLYPSVKYTKGISRSLIYDVENGQYSTIPNTLLDVIECINQNTLSYARVVYKNSVEIFENYLQFLIENRYGFKSFQKIKFGKYDPFFHSAFDFNNVILDYTDESFYNIHNVINNILKTFKVKHFQIRLFSIFSEEYIENIISLFNNSETRSIELIVKDILNKSDLKYWIKIKDKYPKLHKIYIYSSKESGKSPINENIHFSKNNIEDHKSCGVISEDFFTVNLQNSLVGKEKNTCLYKKFAVDRNGFIRNCPSLSEDFGHINNTSLETINKNNSFQKYWSIKKTDVHICSSCEFREICTDCRAYVENPNDMFSKPLKCGYDPITNQWSNWKDVPNKLQAITFYEF